MKKLTLAIAAVLMIGQVAFAQPIHERGVIPVSVTTNQVLRLNIISGGNIEFVFNTIKDYTDGIANVAFYDTKFTVASSKNFDVYLYAEDGSLYGTDNPANTIALNNVGYTMDETGTAANGTNHTLIEGGTTQQGLLLGQVALSKVVTDVGGSSAGDAAANAWTINWECGTTITTSAAGTDMNSSSLLMQSVAPDRYTTNVFLEAVAL